MPNVGRTQGVSPPKPRQVVSAGAIRTPGVGGHSHKKPSPGMDPVSLCSSSRHGRAGPTIWTSVACFQPNYLDFRSHPCAVLDFILKSLHLGHDLNTKAVLISHVQTLSIFLFLCFLHSEVSPLIQILLYESGFSTGCYSVFSQKYQDNILRNGTSSPPALTALEAWVPTYPATL